jgi:hypothetical protein
MIILGQSRLHLPDSVIRSIPVQEKQCEVYPSASQGRVDLKGFLELIDGLLYFIPIIIREPKIVIGGGIRLQNE